MIHPNPNCAGFCNNPNIERYSEGNSRRILKRVGGMHVGGIRRSAPQANPCVNWNMAIIVPNTPRCDVREVAENSSSYFAVLGDGIAPRRSRLTEDQYGKGLEKRKSVIVPGASPKPFFSKNLPETRFPHYGHQHGRIFPDPSRPQGCTARQSIHRAPSPFICEELTIWTGISKHRTMMAKLILG